MAQCTLYFAEKEEKKAIRKNYGVGFVKDLLILSIYNMTKAKQILLNEARKLQSKADRMRKEADRLDAEAQKLKEDANKLN